VNEPGNSATIDVERIAAATTLADLGLEPSEDGGKRRSRQLRKVPVSTALQVQGKVLRAPQVVYYLKSGVYYCQKLSIAPPGKPGFGALRKKSYTLATCPRLRPTIRRS
jgi:hypothetical protein